MKLTSFTPLAAVLLSGVAYAQCDEHNEPFPYSPGTPIASLPSWTITGSNAPIVGTDPTSLSTAMQLSSVATSNAFYSLNGLAHPDRYSVKFQISTSLAGSFSLECPGSPSGRAVIAFLPGSNTIACLDAGGSSTTLNSGLNQITVRIDTLGDYSVVANGSPIFSGPWTPAGSSSTCPSPDEIRFATTGTSSAPNTGLWIDNICINSDTIGTSFCVQTPNSTGAVGVITAFGSQTVSSNSLTLRMDSLPINQFGYFNVGTTESHSFISTIGAYFCIIGPGGSWGRLNRNANEILYSGASGSARLTIDLTNIPLGSTSHSVLPGETFLFQGWHREDGGNSHFTDAVSITFL